MREVLIIANFALNAVSALGAMTAIWWHCKRDIAKRAIQDARLDSLEKLVGSKQ